MKKILLSLIALISVSAFAQDRVSLIREKLLNRDYSSVIVASHRGDWRNYPENSLAAIDNAIKMGVDIVELDVQRTKDGQLILMHDPTLNRTTTGKGAIADTTLAYIKTLKLKNGCAIRTIHNVPTLEEALLHAKGKIMLNLDKADRYFDQVYELMIKTGTTKQIVMKGNESAEKVKALYGDYLKDVIYMPIVNLDKPNAEEQIETFISDMHPVAFELLYKEDSNPLPKKLEETMKGRSLIWYSYLIDVLGARIIQTDRPQFLLDYLRSRNLHD